MVLYTQSNVASPLGWVRRSHGRETELFGSLTNLGAPAGAGGRYKYLANWGREKLRAGWLYAFQAKVVMCLIARYMQTVVASRLSSDVMTWLVQLCDVDNIVLSCGGFVPSCFGLLTAFLTRARCGGRAYARTIKETSPKRRLGPGRTMKLIPSENLRWFTSHKDVLEELCL